MQSTLLTRSTETTTPARSAGATTPAATAQEEAAWTLEALRTVWERQQPRIGERLVAIEEAIAALAEDDLDADLRGEAQRAAHMLAGSVGMFGFLDASQAARNLEAELESPTPDRKPTLSALLESVRHGVQGPVEMAPLQRTPQRTT
jgi:chemotaxis protein histidine kinase CheA